MNPRVGHLPYSWILHQFGSFSVPTPRNLASKIEKCANARVFIQGVRDGRNLNQPICINHSRLLLCNLKAAFTNLKTLSLLPLGYGMNCSRSAYHF